jgi:sugar porter (SP) family MFS transporter
MSTLCQKFNFTLVLVAITASLGGLLSGFDMGVISGALLYINQTWELSPLAQGWIVSSAIVGSVIGAAANGFLADIYGRKKIIIVTAVIFFVGSLLSGEAPSAAWLIGARIIVGLAVGMISFVAPLYLAEIAPEKVRGIFVSLYQVALTAGILLSYLINRIFANFDYNWRWMLSSGALPAVILLIGILFLHDTPRWLISKGRIQEARHVFECIHEANIDQRIADIQSTLHTPSQHAKIHFQSWMIMPVFVGIGLMFVQICTGINTIIYYTPTIFNLAGFSDNISALYATIGIGVVNFAMTFVAIAYTDRFGRKPLLYIGLSGMLLSLLTLSGSFALGDSGKWVAVTSVVVYIASFAMSLGPLCWVMISEIMPLQIRGLAMSASAVANFAFNFMVVLGFLPMLEFFGKTVTFLIFALIALISLFFVYFFVPETKGISLEKIEENWHKGISPRQF